MGSLKGVKRIPRALSIAGSDSGGGAGIQADLKTFFALGVHGTCAVTALTAQNTTGVSAVQESSPEFVVEQIAQVVSDIGVDAAKTGMLSSAPIVEAVARAVERFGIDKLVVDPVFVSKNGDRLLAADAIQALVTKLFPLALVVTPNLLEAGDLLGGSVSTLDEMKQAARELHEFGPRFVVVKGGHLQGDATDVVYDGSSIEEIPGEPIETPHKHGAGCTLAAATAAYLARGESPMAALSAAKVFVTGAIKHGLALGKGYGPVNQGWDSTLKL